MLLVAVVAGSTVAAGVFAAGLAAFVAVFAAESMAVLDSGSIRVARISVRRMTIHCLAAITHILATSILTQPTGLRIRLNQSPRQEPLTGIIAMIRRATTLR